MGRTSKDSTLKTPETLTPELLHEYPVWEFVNDDSIGELALRPIKKMPVEALNSRLAGSQLRLASGKLVWGMLGNVEVNNPKLNEHFVTVSVFHKSKWFTMARYHDFDSGENGPEALAIFLSLEVRDVFPISYDLRGISQGELASS